MLWDIIYDRLTIHVVDATKWRDQNLEYFGRFSKRPVMWAD